MRILLWLTLGGVAHAAGPFDNLGAEDLARGRRLFEAQCAVCHGINGAGGKGANLAVVKFRRAPDDDALVKVVREGVPDSEMPAAWWMNDRESVQVAYYVRSLGRIASSIKIAGDRAAGKEVFFGKGGCAACHNAGGPGGSVGPDLTDVGARRSPLHLRQSVLDASTTTPAGFLMVRVALKTGKELRGIRLNEDTFTIQLKDLSGRFLSFRKSEVAGVYKEVGQTPMPSYKDKLSETELDNLVAYLVSLRGEQ